LWVSNTEHAACHPSGTQNFEVTPVYFGKFLHPWYKA